MPPLKSAFHLSSAPVNIYTMAGMIWALSSHYFPLAYLAIGPALRALDVRMEEAGLMSGGRYWHVLPKITLPLLRPAILSGLLLLFIMGMSSYEVPRLIGRPARIDVFTTEIQSATASAPPEFGVASALSLTLLLTCIVAVYFYRRATRNAEAFATITGKGYKPTRIELGRWRWPVAGAIGFMFLIALGLPLFTLAWQSFFRNLSQPFMGSPSPATLENYRFILSYPVFLDAVRTSVVVSAMAATFVVALTLVMAWMARRSASRFAWLLDALASAPIAIPSVIVGASILFTYLVVPIPIYNTIWILLVAYVTLCLPYGMRFASSGITQIHRELEEAASVSGATLGQIFLRVMFPLILPFLLAAWIYVFVLSVRELGASVFLVGPGTSVLGTVSLTMWEEGGSYGAVAALGVLQILPLLVIVAGSALAGDARAAARPSGRREELARIFQNVHALAPAVDQIEPAVVVRADVVRLDARRAVGPLRHVAADFFRMQRVADVDRAQAGVEIGQEHDVLPRPLGGQVLQNVVGAEAAGAVVIFFAVGHEGCDRQRIGLVARVDHPHELRVPEFLF